VTTMGKRKFMSHFVDSSEKNTPSEPLSDALLSKAEDERLLEVDRVVEECKQEVDAIQNKSSHIKNMKVSKSFGLTAKEKFSVIAIVVGIAISAIILKKLFILFASWWLT
jgi:phosphopantetheine adenylyltransferase